MSQELLPYQSHHPPSILGNSGTRRAILAGVAILVLFFGVLVGWAALAPLNSAVVSVGVIKVEGNRQAVQHLDGGIVAAILVKEGEKVRAGQTLVRLDDVGPRANVDSLQAQFDSLQALESRLLAEQKDLDEVVFPASLQARAAAEPIVAQYLQSQRDQFAARRRSISGLRDIQRQRIEQLKEQIIGARGQIAATDRQLALAGEQARDVKSLYDEGYATKSRLLDLQRSVAALQGTAADLRATVARLSQQIGETEIQLGQLERDRQSEVAESLRDVTARLFDLGPRLHAAKDVLARVALVAPMGGYVVGMKIFTVGGVINRGDVVLEIVPVDSPLVAETRVSPDAVEEIRPGMTTEVRLTAFKQSAMPKVSGQVLKVSADRLNDPRTNQDYFSITSSVDVAELAAAGVALAPGMNVDVIIPLRARTALAYMMSPLTRAWDRALREK